MAELIEGEPGEFVGVTIKRAIKAADSANATVTMKHNDIIVLVPPGSSLEAVFKVWQANCEERRDVYEASTEGQAHRAESMAIIEKADWRKVRLAGLYRVIGIIERGDA